MFGLNADPTSDPNHTTLNYAWYQGADGIIYIYENGVSMGAFGAYSTTANRTFYFDSSLYHTNFQLNNIQFRPLATETFYEYDAGGNRTRERTLKNGITYQDARTTYDALGRMTQVGDNLYSLSYRYDAVGNRRRAVSRYYDENSTLKTTDNWYLYDGMNRITLSQGGLVNGVLVSNPNKALVLAAGGGVTLAGNSATKTGAVGWDAGVYSQDGLTGNAYVSATGGQTTLYGMFGLNADPVADNNYTSLDYAWYTEGGGALHIFENGIQIGVYRSYSTSDVLAIAYDGSNVRYLINGEVKRTVATTANRTLYFDSSFSDTHFRLNNIRFEANSSQGTVLAYDAAGNRRQATRWESGVAVTEAYTYDSNNRLVSTNKSGSLTASRSYDDAGRVTEQVTYSSPGVVSERRANTYNANGWLTQQEIKNGAGTLTQRMSYNAYDALGNVKSYQVQVFTGTAYTNTYTTTYAKFDGYKEQKQAGTSTYFQAGATTSSYDVNGNITAISETFTVAAEAGLQEAQGLLALIYALGDDVPQNLEKANYWWKRYEARTAEHYIRGE